MGCCVRSENILFGKAYDEAQFRTAVHVCCMEQDIASMAHGEHTVIGSVATRVSAGALSHAM